MTDQKILDAMAEAERKAWESLAGYKFWMFGYHAAGWVRLNALLENKRPNPFRRAVKLAREVLNGEPPHDRRQDPDDDLRLVR